MVGQTSWLAHWEQKVGGGRPPMLNRLRRQWTQRKKLVSTFLHHIKDHLAYPSSLTRRMVGEVNLLYLKFYVKLIPSN